MRKIWITEWAMVMFHIPVVQLKDQPPSRNKSFILVAAMVALTGEQTLIPAAAALDIAHANERLRMHGGS
jgi:hypothetical protein